MRLYITVAVLTFACCFAAYSGSHMLGAARAIGGDRAGGGAGAFASHFNPFLLLQTDRLRAMLSSSSSSLPRMEPFRSNFSVSVRLHGWQPPKLDPQFGRTVYISPPRHVAVPQISAPRPIRIGR
jgi:hypothetical protein